MSPIYSALLKLFSITPVYGQSKTEGFNLGFQYWPAGVVMQLCAWFLCVVCYCAYIQKAIAVLAAFSLPLFVLWYKEYRRLQQVSGLGFDGRFFIVLRPSAKRYVDLQGEVLVSGQIVALVFKCGTDTWPLLITAATVGRKDFHVLRQFFICAQSSTEMTRS